MKNLLLWHDSFASFCFEKSDVGLFVCVRFILQFSLEMNVKYAFYMVIFVFGKSKKNGE